MSKICKCKNIIEDCGSKVCESCLKKIAIQQIAEKISAFLKSPEFNCFRQMKSVLNVDVWCEASEEGKRNGVRILFPELPKTKDEV